MTILFVLGGGGKKLEHNCAINAKLLEQRISQGVNEMLEWPLQKCKPQN
jgi:hypothetical protein